MTLQEAIEEVRRSGVEEGEFEDWQMDHGFIGDLATAIATILNAVVKGELRAQPEPRQPILDRFAMRNGHNAQRPDEVREDYNMRVYGLREEDIE